MTEPIDETTNQAAPKGNQAGAMTQYAAAYFMDMALSARFAAMVFPVAYSILLLVIVVGGSISPDRFAFTLETLAFVTLPFAGLCWCLSFRLKLCNCYRIHLIIMLLPLAIPLMRTFAPGISLTLVRWIVSAPLLITTGICVYRFNADSEFRRYKRTRVEALSAETNKRNNNNTNNK